MATAKYNICGDTIMTNDITISGTDIVTVIWFTNSRNHTFLPHNFYLPRKRWLNSWRWDICWGLHLLLHLEKKILGPGLLCRTTALHYNAVCLKCYIYPPKKSQLLQFKHCYTIFLQFQWYFDCFWLIVQDYFNTQCMIWQTVQVNFLKLNSSALLVKS